MSKPSPIETLLDKVDNYTQTVGAIIALGHILKHDYNGEYKIGPKFQTSAANRISRDTEVTPDIAGQTQTMSIVGEVKKSFPENQDHWEDDIKQLEKYDDVLTGWPLKPVSDHDIILLTGYYMSGKLRKYIDQKIAKGDLTFNRSLAILEFVRTQDRREYWALRKIWGTLSDKAFDERIEDPIGVPGDTIVPDLSSVKFYDSEPHVVYTMSLLWDFVFSEKAPAEKFREAEGRKTIDIVFTIDDAHQKLKTFFGPPNSSLPRRAWVANAMKGFETVGLAKKRGDGFFITYHRMPESKSLQYFAEAWIEKVESQAKITDLMPEAKDVSKN